MDDDPQDLASVKDRPVETQNDLERLWRALMGDLGFGGRSLWMLFLDDHGLAVPMISQIEELPITPDGNVAGVIGILDQVLHTDGRDGSVALLLSRPGRCIEDSDRAWARALADEAERMGLPLWPTHLATDLELCVIAPDDLLHVG